MKKYLVAALSCATLAAFASTPVTWSTLSNTGTFYITIVQHQVKSVADDGVLPLSSASSGEQTIKNCQAADTLDGFKISCGQNSWVFHGSRFSCEVGGGGRWTNSINDIGAYMCTN